jgi:hypothetical protein
MLVSLKAKKNAKSGLARQYLVPMTLRAPMPTLHGTSWVHLIARYPRLLHIDVQVNKHGIRAGNPELSRV